MPTAPRRPVMPRNRDRSGASASAQQPGGQRAALPQRRASAQTRQTRQTGVAGQRRPAVQPAAPSRGAGPQQETRAQRGLAAQQRPTAQQGVAAQHGAPAQQGARGAVLHMGTTKIDRTPPTGLATTRTAGSAGTGLAAARGTGTTVGLAAGRSRQPRLGGYGGGGRAADRPGARPDRGTAYSARRRPDRPGSRQAEEAWQSSGPETGPTEQVAQEKAMSRPMAVLFLVACMVVAAFIVMSPLRTLMDQRAERADLVEQIAQAQERNEKLRQELAKWEDPNVVRREARERLGFVQPGEKVYIVTDSSVAQPGPSETEDPALRPVIEPDSWVRTLWQGQAPSSIPLRDQPTAPPGIIKQDGEK